MNNVVVNMSSSSYWLYNFQWTDEAGAEQVTDLILLYGNLGYGQQASGAPAIVFTFLAKAGQPVTYTITQQGNPDNSAYSLYHVVERLE